LYDPVRKQVSAGMEVESPTTLAAPEWFDGALQWIALCFEAIGVAAIALGVLIAAVQAGREASRGNDWGEIYHLFRTSLARGILLGLEFLVAADIIGTVAVDPTLQNLSVLGLIVLIRTFLSFALQLEISGRWPWQRASQD
jgi:uncharacterized membrane protein